MLAKRDAGRGTEIKRMPHIWATNTKSIKRARRKRDYRFAPGFKHAKASCYGVISSIFELPSRILWQDLEYPKNYRHGIWNCRHWMN